MGWSWLRRRADRGNAPAPAAVPVPGHRRRVPREPDWPHLSPVQRTLADPLTPVAPLDRFTGSLATHQNPSFLATLGHHVDPDGPGGLVTGLAVPRAGRPVPYAGTAELAVPSREKSRPAVQRQVASWSTPTEPMRPEPVAVMRPELDEGPSSGSGHMVQRMRPELDEGPRSGSGEGPSSGSGHMAAAPVLATNRCRLSASKALRQAQGTWSNACGLSLTSLDRLRRGPSSGSGHMATAPWSATNHCGLSLSKALRQAQGT